MRLLKRLPFIKKIIFNVTLYNQLSLVLLNSPAAAERIKIKDLRLPEYKFIL